MNGPVCETRIIYGRFEVRAERLHQVAQRLRRELFGSQLDEEVAAAFHPAPPSPTDSTIGKPNASREA